jgi:hypothetical protein
MCDCVSAVFVCLTRNHDVSTMRSYRNATVCVNMTTIATTTRMTGRGQERSRR